MKRTKRTPFEIKRDIQEYKQKMQEATLRRDFVRINMFSQKVAQIEKELDDLMADKVFFSQEKNLDKHLVSWAAKTLALTLNMADMSVYYYDLYMAYFKERGFEPVPEWKRKAENLRKAATEFREFVSFFFKGKNEEMYYQSMGDLLEIIAKHFYTDRERKYYEEYDRK